MKYSWKLLKRIRSFYVLWIIKLPNEILYNEPYRNLLEPFRQHVERNYFTHSKQ